MSILAKFNKDVADDEPLIQVRDVVNEHRKRYGRNFFCRYDYEGVDTDAANSVVDLSQDELLGDQGASIDVKFVQGEEFAYTDPGDGSQSSKQGLILSFEYPNGDAARLVFRLSETGSAGAMISVYLEKFEQDPEKHDETALVALRSLADRAVAMVKMAELTGRDAPTVITKRIQSKRKG